jgi:hypothetical protein
MRDGKSGWREGREAVLEALVGAGDDADFLNSAEEDPNLNKGKVPLRLLSGLA